MEVFIQSGYGYILRYSSQWKFLFKAKIAKPLLLNMKMFPRKIFILDRVKSLHDFIQNIPLFVTVADEAKTPNLLNINVYPRKETEFCFSKMCCICHSFKRIE